MPQPLQQYYFGGQEIDADKYKQLSMLNQFAGKGLTQNQANSMAMDILFAPPDPMKQLMDSLYGGQQEQQGQQQQFQPMGGAVMGARPSIMDAYGQGGQVAGMDNMGDDFAIEVPDAPEPYQKPKASLLDILPGVGAFRQYSDFQNVSQSPEAQRMRFGKEMPAMKYLDPGYDIARLYTAFGNPEQGGGFNNLLNEISYDMGGDPYGTGYR